MKTRGFSKHNLKLLIALIILFFLLGFLKILSWVYAFDEIVNILICVCVVLGILIIGLFCNLLFRKNKLSFMKKALVFILFIFFFYLFNLFILSNKVELYNSSLTNIESKEQDGKNYSLILYNSNLKRSIKVICDKKVYDSIIVDKLVLYPIEYRTIACLNYYSRLLSISDYVDNRDKNK